MMNHGAVCLVGFPAELHRSKDRASKLCCQIFQRMRNGVKPRILLPICTGIAGAQLLEVIHYHEVNAACLLHAQRFTA